MSILELSKVSKVYRSGVVSFTALHPIDLALEAGDFVCLAGPSGSGKTTLLNLMGGLDTPSSGEIRLLSRPLVAGNRRQSAALRRDHLGFVFQTFNLIPVLTAFENVEYVLLLQGVPHRERRARTRAALAGVGLAGQEDKKPAQLSGGQQQRVAVARALVGRPDLVLADEPTANLDSRTGAELLQLLRDLNRVRGTTFVFSSHDPMIIDCAARVVRLRDGEVISQ